MEWDAWERHGKKIKSVCFFLAKQYFRCIMLFKVVADREFIQDTLGVRWDSTWIGYQGNTLGALYSRWEETQSLNYSHQKTNFKQLNNSTKQLC